MELLSQSDIAGCLESLDGEGTGDHNLPYRFGNPPRASAPYPFSTRQYVRLLILRSRVQDKWGGDSNVDAKRGPAAAA